MTEYWCEWAVLEGEAVPRVRVSESDGIITAIETAADAAEGDFLLPGLTLPGLANGHSHAFHRALRGRTHGDGGTFWTWREKMYAIANQLEPDTYLQLATAVFAEMVLAGYTVVGEFHYLHRKPDGSPYDPPTAMEDAVVEAARRAGIRLTLLDALYLDGGMGTPLSPEQRRFSDGSVENWVARRDAVQVGPLARRGAAVHSVRAVRPELFEQVRRATRETVLHAHVSEQPAENEAARVAYGHTPTELFAAGGLIDHRFTAVHGTHLTDGDIVLLENGASFVCFCPTTERDLADGIGRAGDLHERLRLTIGSDQNAVVDPFEEIRGLEMNERLRSGERGRLSPTVLISAASRNGYDSLGWQGGALEPGMVCDLVTIDLRSPRTAGVDPGQAWFAATGADVTSVIVGGAVQVANGRHRLGDVGALLGSALERLDP